MTKTLHNFMLVSEFPPLTSNLKKVHYNTCTDWCEPVSKTIYADNISTCQSFWSFIFVPNLVFLTRPSLQILGKILDGSISDFWISGQSLIKRNCQNFRTCDDIDMKLGPVTKFHKRNKTTWKTLDDDDNSENCDVITIFSFYG